MEKIKCKECGKEINKKAEICPHCGCRVKSNTIKIAIVCIIIIGVFIGIYFSYETIKSRYNNKIRQDEQIKKEEYENKVVESYLGNYKLSFNESLFYGDYSYYDSQFSRTYIELLKENVDLSKKCYRKDPDYPEYTQEGDITKDCVVLDNLSDNGMLLIVPWDGMHIYIDKTKSIAEINLGNFVEKGVTNPDEYVCFQYLNSSNDVLTQIECSETSGHKNVSLNTKYEFKLTRIK